MLKTEIQANKAFALDQRLKAVVEDSKQNFFIIGALLVEIHDNDYYQLMGYETFRSYLGDPEISLKYSTAYHAMKVVKKFELDETVGINYSKLIMIAPHINKENKADLLEKAQSLSQSDLRREIRVMKGEEDPDARMIICPKCGEQFEI